MNAMIYMPKAVLADGNGKHIADVKDLVIHLGDEGKALGYTEVKTPQTPECLHDWRQDWGFSGPICVCNKCGSWHHD